MTMLEERPQTATAPPQRVRVAIVGSGFAGLAMAIRLKQQGDDDFVVLERAGDVGGTWRDNSYPGCQCDVPSHLYSFSFEPNPNWSRTFSTQPEIQEYLRHCARKFGILPHVRFHCELRDARWDDDAQRWMLRTSHGVLSAQFLVAAAGPLSEPKIPALPGLDGFRGTVFHSAQWNHEHDLRGRRVAVVGTGASAIQFVPRIQPLVAQLTLFQRTPAWVMPHPDRPIRDWERRAYSALPALQTVMRGGIYMAREAFVIGFLRNRMHLATRIARRHLARQVPDAALRAKLTPRYTIGCKRILLSNDFYPALTQPNVDVVTSGLRDVRATTVVDAAGNEHEVDTIIFGTGFHVTDMPIGDRVHDAAGVSLTAHWQGSPQAYLGTTVAGYPNFFMLLGPNTGLGHTSVVVMAEAQVDYVLDALRCARDRDAGAVEVRAEAQDAYNAQVQSRVGGTVWNSGGCASWYIDATGRNTTIWPGSTLSFRRSVRRFDPEHYLLRAPVRELAGSAAAP
jgi:cation diffusion facilitator CzcD-associated flavoprotein CzcO